ncbi:hypothetical protein C8J56DRAFT_1058117 [Mycena floridula]|nr:hypothetical protein C8J56DRAFT_1058117 [Mycena floridula]
MKNLETWKLYHREYSTIAGWLLAKDLITEHQRDAYFFAGIEPVKGKELADRYLTQVPGSKLSDPIPITQLDNMIESSFDDSEDEGNWADREYERLNNKTKKSSRRSREDSEDEYDSDRDYEHHNSRSKRTARKRHSRECRDDDRERGRDRDRDHGRRKKTQDKQLEDLTLDELEQFIN